MPKQWLHGFLEACLLGLLAERRDYGLGLADRLRETGFGEVAGGTLYPALLRLEKVGYLDTERQTSTSGPPRKYYVLTDVGREALHEYQGSWQWFRYAVDAAVGFAPATAGEERPPS